MVKASPGVGTERGQLAVSHERVGGHDAGTEAREPTGDPLADASEPDDADRRRAEFATSAYCPVPQANPPVAVDSVSKGGEHEPDGMVGHRIGVGSRGVGDDDATASRGIHVHCLVAHSIAGHDPKVRREGEVLVGDRSGPGDPRIGLGKHGGDRRKVMVGWPAGHGVAGLGEARDEVDVSARERAAGGKDGGH